MTRFDRKKNELLIGLLFIVIFLIHFYRIYNVFSINKLQINIYKNSFIIFSINMTLFLSTVIVSKKNNYSNFNYFILFFNIYLALIEPFEIGIILARLNDLNEGYYSAIYKLLEHASYIFSAKAFHFAYVLSAYYAHKITLKKLICLMLLQFFPLIGLLAINRELFNDQTIDKRIIFVLCFVTVLFFIICLSLLLYVGYIIYSF